jgi:hypothetical protein
MSASPASGPRTVAAVERLSVVIPRGAITVAKQCSLSPSPGPRVDHVRVAHAGDVDKLLGVTGGGDRGGCAVGRVRPSGGLDLQPQDRGVESKTTMSPPASKRGASNAVLAQHADGFVAGVAFGDSAEVEAACWGR